MGVCVGENDKGMEADLSNVEELEKEMEEVGNEGEIVIAEGLLRGWEEDNGESERDRDREWGSVEEEVKLWDDLLRKGEG